MNPRPPGTVRLGRDRDPARETLELVRAYHAIREPALRGMVLALVKRLGTAPGDEPPGVVHPVRVTKFV